MQTTRTDSPALKITAPGVERYARTHAELVLVLADIAGHKPEPGPGLSSCPEFWASGSTSTEVTISFGEISHTASAKRWHRDARETWAPRWFGGPCAYYLGEMFRARALAA